jgi:hypothetical protein
MRNKAVKRIFGILLTPVFLLAGCGEQPAGSPEAAKPEETVSAPQAEEMLPQALPAAAQPTELEKPESEPRNAVPPDPPEEQSQRESNTGDIDWGSEVDLDEMIAMAQRGYIREIQWHVMPNILRAETQDNRIYHLRNENKSVDLRNTLIKAGVRIGKGGVIFRHVF